MASATFKAARISEYALTEEKDGKTIKDVVSVVDVPKPTEIPEGFALVKVHSVAANPIDWKIITGFSRSYANVEFPETAGFDFAGTVEAVGAGVDLAVGTKVTGFNGLERYFAHDEKYFHGPSTGSFAEYVVTPAVALVGVPEGLSLSEAAAIPLAGCTAYEALFVHGGLNKEGGQKVLVLGGAGGCGTFGIQLAKKFGHFVATTASPRNIQLVTSLGADQVIDYKAQKWADVLAGQDFDLIFNAAELEMNADDYEKVLKPNGVGMSICAPPSRQSERNKLAFFIVRSVSRENGLTELVDLVNKGEVKVVVDGAKQFQGLDQVVDLLEYSRSGKAQGKLVLNVL